MACKRYCYDGVVYVFVFDSIINSRCCRFFLLFFGFILTKTSHFSCKINKFRTFLLIYLRISKIFRTFAAGFLVRVCVHTCTYKQTPQITTNPTRNEQSGYRF